MPWIKTLVNFIKIPFLIKFDHFFFLLDHVFEVMIYVDNSADYDEPWKCIDNLKVIQDIVKKSGMRCMIASEPTSHTTNKEVIDAEKR